MGDQPGQVEERRRVATRVVMRLAPRPGGAASISGRGTVVDERGDCSAQAVPIAGRDNDARAAAVEKLRDGPHAGGHHGQAAGHRLQHHPRCRVAVAGQAQAIRGLKEGEQSRIAAAQTVHRDSWRRRQRVRRDDVQVSPSRLQPRPKRSEQVVAALTREPRSDEQRAEHVVVALTLLARPEVLEVQPWVLDDHVGGRRRSPDALGRPRGPGDDLSGAAERSPLRDQAGGDGEL